MVHHENTPRVRGTEPDEFAIRDMRSFPDISGDPRMFRRLTDTVAVMTAGGARAEEIYQRALARVRDDEDFAVLVLKTHDALAQDAYIERWALVQLAIDLEHPAAGELLADIVRRPVPDERSADPAHGISTVTEEVLLRTTAMEGLSRLFRHGVDTSDVLLETIARADYTAMRRAAWFALVDGDQRDTLERARALLDERGDGWIADLQRHTVSDAEQADIDRIDPPQKDLPDIPRPFDE
jgi:hypothetical protein